MGATHESKSKTEKIMRLSMRYVLIHREFNFPFRRNPPTRPLPKLKRWKTSRLIVTAWSLFLMRDVMLLLERLWCFFHRISSHFAATRRKISTHHMPKLKKRESSRMPTVCVILLLGNIWFPFSLVAYRRNMLISLSAAAQEMERFKIYC